MEQLRKRAIAVIDDHPGISITGLAKQLDLGMMKTAEVIGGLLALEQIHEHNEGSSRRMFFTKEPDEALVWLARHPKATQALQSKATNANELVRLDGWPKSTAEWYVRKLNALGLWRTG